jgi:hypothetical protein
VAIIRRVILLNQAVRLGAILAMRRQGRQDARQGREGHAGRLAKVAERTTLVAGDFEQENGVG